MRKRKSRICMLTARDVTHNAFRGGIYEAQDVLSDIDDVDLIYLKPRRGYQLRQYIQQRIVWHDFTRVLASVNMAFEPVRLTKEYDLFVAYFPLMRDLIQVPAVQGWKDYCRTSVCWIDEIYAVDIPKFKNWFSALRHFDHIVIGYSGTVAALAEAIKRPCHCVPIGVDTIRFSPYPRPPHRVIDVYNMGRRSEELHRVLLELAAKKDMFYVYDTFVASDTKINDHQQHREMLANIAKRSRYFIVAPSRHPRRHSLEETGDQTEVALRYYEASAAGAIMIGQSPRCETFSTMFNWQDAVIEIKADGSDLADTISDLEAQPKWLLRISRRNAMEALLRHDWAHRWKKVLDIVGLKPALQLEIRENRLKQLAEQAGNGLW
jgi:RNA polymerase subunit RPABC4/transcription elongation factor Spt4